MKKLMVLFILFTSLSVVATATEYEDIAELVTGFSDRIKMSTFDKTGNYCFAADGAGVLHVFDVSDIFTLTSFTTKSPVASLALTGKSGYGQALAGDYLYTARSGGAVVDVSNPLIPTQVGSFTTTTSVSNMIIYDHPLTGIKYLIVVEYSSKKVEVFDLSVPTAPVMVGSSVATTSEMWSLDVYYDGTDVYLYAAGGWSSPMLYIYDFNDPTNLASITPTSTALSLLPYQLKVSGNKLVTSCTHDTFLYDLSSPYAPVVLDAKAFDGYGRVCAKDDLNIVFLGDVYKVDHNSSTLEPVQTYDTHGSGTWDGFPYGSDVHYQGSDGKVALSASTITLILRTKAAEKSFETDVTQISSSIGGQANFALDASAANAGRGYMIFGSVTGTTPGIPLPGGMATLPVNWDIFTDIVLALINTPLFVNFAGSLDSQGQATAMLDTLGPLPVANGVTLYFAYALKPPFNFASNFVTIEFIP